MASCSTARRILLLGQASSTRLLICHVLNNLHYVVDEVRDPTAETVSGTDYALVVLGVGSLDGDIAQAVSMVRARFDGPHAPPFILVGGPQALAALQAGEPDVQAYFPEPVDLGQFLATVLCLTDETSHRPTGKTAGPSAVDLDRLNSFAGNDPGLVQELTALYFTTARAYLAEMVLGVESHRDVSRPVHSLKGASANYGAVEVADSARIAEQQGVTVEHIQNMTRALGRAEQFMTALDAQGNIGG